MELKDGMEENTIIICKDSKIQASFSWNVIFENSKMVLQNEYNSNIFECKGLCAFSVREKKICCHPMLDDEMRILLEKCVQEYYNRKAKVVFDREKYTYTIMLDR